MYKWLCYPSVDRNNFLNAFCCLKQCHNFKLSHNIAASRPGRLRGKDHCLISTLLRHKYVKRHLTSFVLRILTLLGQQWAATEMPYSGADIKMLCNISVRFLCSCEPGVLKILYVQEDTTCSYISLFIILYAGRGKKNYFIV